MKLHDYVVNKYFDLTIAAIIFLNVISMALEHYQMVYVSSNVADVADVIDQNCCMVMFADICVVVKLKTTFLMTP